MDAEAAGGGAREPSADRAGRGGREGSARSRRARTALAASLVAVLGALGLAWPALWNGFPLVFNDSAIYVANAASGHFNPSRAIGYALFVRAATPGGSLWGVVAAQALATAVLLGRVAAVAVPAAPWRAAALGLGSVAVLTTGPRYASWIMADVGASWLFLAPALWLLSRRPADRALAGAATVAAVLAHNSHLPIAAACAAGLVGVSVVLALRGVPGARRAAAAALAWALVVAFSVPVSLGLNRAFAGRWSVLNGTRGFLLNRFVDSGVAGATLDRFCGERDWTLCAHRAAIDAHAGTSDDWFAWGADSPFRQSEGWSEREFEEVVAHAFRCCLGRIVSTSLVGAARQLFEVDEARDLSPEMTRTTALALRQFHPEALEALATSRQATGRAIPSSLLPIPQEPLFVVLLGAGAALAVLALRRRRWRIGGLEAGCIAFLCVNALVVGFASTLHGRYQGRVAWLMAFAVALAAVDVFASRASRRAAPSARGGEGGA